MNTAAHTAEDFRHPTFPATSCPELHGEKRRHPVVVLGAGPVGLSAAIDFSLHGVPVIVLDNKDTVSDGSRAICWAKRTLEICDRLGVGDRLVGKGVTWSKGHVYHGDRQIYAFDLLPESDHKRPAFINLQQYYYEHFMLDHIAKRPDIGLRWQHTITGVMPGRDSVTVTVDTPLGGYELEAEWVLAADGVRSVTRRSLGRDFAGKVFEDRFLIADIRMEVDDPAIRRFWFDPAFHDGQSALMHKQADDVWRIDFQLGWGADPDEERKPENVIPRLRRMLGDTAFEIVWTSVYTFTCRRMERFRHGRVFFVGDSAHVVSPFGARGGNGGVQDADNLVWKLCLVLNGDAPDRLLDSYDDERIVGADENILNSTRSTDFMTPKNQVSRAFRDAVLDLARDYEFARRLVNGGRLSVPSTYANTPLNTPDTDPFAGDMIPGAPCVDAPLTGETGNHWLLDRLGNDFALLYFASADGVSEQDQRVLATLRDLRPPIRPLVLGSAGDATELRGVASARYDAQPGTVYLIRPDQHVAARWRSLDPEAVQQALDHCLCRS